MIYFSLVINSGNVDTITPLVSSMSARGGFLEGQECLIAKLKDLGGQFSLSTPVDLYSDESMQLNRQVKDYTDISTVFTDFSKSFNLPATDTNNAIFQNFFDENVLLQSWNQNYALDAQIYIHGLPVFNGVVELLEVKFTNGLPSDYSIVFYGQGKNIILGWGEQTLANLDWSAYNHIISDAIAVSSWSGGLLAGKVMWDLKDYGYGITYSTFNTRNNIFRPDNFSYLNLRPSILLKEMVQNIFEQQGYELGGTLLARPEFNNLYVTPMNTAGPFIDLQNGTSFGNFIANNGTAQAIIGTSNNLNTWNTLPIGNTVTSGNISAAWNTSTYEYTIPQNGNYTFNIDITTLTSNSRITIKPVISGKYSGSQITFIPTGSQSIVLNNLSKGDVFKILYRCNANGTVLGSMSCINSPATVLPTCIMADAMPEIKVADFFDSFLKSYNAVIIPNSYTSFELHNLEDWYASGQNVEYTEFIDFKSLTHKKMPVPSKVTMMHENGETLPQVYFNDSYKREFGSVAFSPEIDFTENAFNIKTIFQVNPPVILRQTNQNGVIINDTDLEIPAIYDKDAKAVDQKLILFYYNGLVSTNYNYYFGATQYSSYPKSSSFSGITTNSYSLAFGLEANRVGDMPKKTLYFQFWNNYISRMYSTRSRIVIVNAILPVGVWLNMKLNDNVAISGNYYKIQKITYDLLSQKAVIELMTYPNVNVLTITSTSGKKPTFDTVALNEYGQTFVDGNPLKKAIANAIYDGTDYLTNGLDIANFNQGLAFEFMTLRDNYIPTLSLNKLSIWNLTTVGYSITPTYNGFTMTNSGSEGDVSYYTQNLANSEITINSDGQYRFKATIVFDGTGNHHLGFVILIDGIESEAYSETHHNNIITVDISGTATIGENQVLQLRGRTLDGGTHAIDINRVYLIVERII